MSKNPIPQGKYKPAVRYGNLIFTAGMTPGRTGCSSCPARSARTVLWTNTVTR